MGVKDSWNPSDDMSNIKFCCTVKVKKQKSNILLNPFKVKRMIIDDSSLRLNKNSKLNALTFNPHFRSKEDWFLPLSAIEFVDILDLPTRKMVIVLKDKFKEIKGGKLVVQFESFDLLESAKEALDNSTFAERAQDFTGTNQESFETKYRLDKKDKTTVLGNGSFGKVTKVQRISDGEWFAMKTINTTSFKEDDVDDLRNEVKMLKSVNHPNICKLYDTYETETHTHLVMDMCEGGDMGDMKLPLSEDYACKLMTKMVGVLSYLEHKKIVHRDIKLKNWMFRSKGHSQESASDDIVLIDFGFAHKFNSKVVMTETTGTVLYLAPEVIDGNYNGSECDMWSTGVLAFMLVGGYPPFFSEDGNKYEVMNKIAQFKSMDFTHRFKFDHASDSYKDFVSKLLVKDPKKRMTAAAALKHPWIAQFEAKAAKKAVIPDNVLSNMRDYAAANDFKKVTMEVVAYNLSHNEIQELSELFQAADVNHDGTLTEEELAKAFDNHSKISDADVKRVFDAMDKSGTGKIQLNDFIAGAITQRYLHEDKYLKEAFEVMDKDHSGGIQVHDLRKLLGSLMGEKRIEEMISQVCDAYGDEKGITYTQFQRILMENRI